MAYKLFSLAVTLCIGLGPLRLVGVGAGTVNRAAEQLNPEYRADYRGWGWYWTAFAMGTIGGLTLQNAVEKANEAGTDEERQEALDETVFPVLLILGSAVCGIVSWVKFGKLAGEGSRAARGNTALELQPTLTLVAAGHAAPGLHLAYRF